MNMSICRFATHFLSASLLAACTQSSFQEALAISYLQLYATHGEMRTHIYAHSTELAYLENLTRQPLGYHEGFLKLADICRESMCVQSKTPPRAGDLYPGRTFHLPVLSHSHARLYARHARACPPWKLHLTLACLTRTIRLFFYAYLCGVRRRAVPVHGSDSQHPVRRRQVCPPLLPFL